MTTNLARTGPSLLCLTVAACLARTAVAEAVHTDVLVNEPERIVVHYRFGEPRSASVDIDGGTYEALWLPGEPVSMEKGAPAVPYVCRSVIIPADAAMSVRVLSAEYDERPAQIVPSAAASTARMTSLGSPSSQV